MFVKGLMDCIKSQTTHTKCLFLEGSVRNDQCLALVCDGNNKQYYQSFPCSNEDYSNECICGNKGKIKSMTNRFWKS